jgi:IPT/TIG domain-containing protein
MPKSREPIDADAVLIDIDANVRPFVRGSLPRLDPLDPNTAELLKSNPGLAQGLLQSRVIAATHFSDGLVGIIKDPSFDLGKLLKPNVPGQLTGVLLQPTSAPANRVQVSITKPFASGPGPGTAITGSDGLFALAVPEDVRTAPGIAKITLSITGATANVTVDIDVSKIGSSGSVGNVTLPKAVDPLPVSVIDQLGDIVSNLELPDPTKPGDCNCNDTAVPAVTLGADVCTQVFRSDLSVDRFPYGVLVRLVEPRPSIASLAVRVKRGDKRVNISAAYLATMDAATHPYRHADRLPIDQPLSIDAFRNGVAGVNVFGTGTNASTVPVAGTLGLGYIVHMAQRWTAKGLALGDLVYSLPLAPGEQQRVAVVDRRATSSVMESERLDVQEAQSFRERDDSSTRATFESGMHEAANGGSRFHTEAESSSWGAAGGIGFALGPIAIGGGAAGGGGSSSSSGETNNWMSGVRNYTSTAAQSSHASVERSANARRSAQRMAMRLASASERTEVVTKVITNHNKTRALTMQYWEVLRLFDVRSTVEGVTLVCFVPLDPIRFLPAGQPVTLSNAALDRGAVLNRYERLLTYTDTLRRVVESPYRKGLAVLEEFAADPRATVQTPTDAATNVVTIYAQGTFLPFEDVWVTLLAKGGRRVGPYPMPTSGIAGIPTYATDPANAYRSQAELLGALRARRNGAFATINRSVVLPDWLPRTDVVGVEISRQFQSLHYHFASSVAGDASVMNKIAPGSLSSMIGQIMTNAHPAHDVTFSADRLEQEVGGPHMTRVKAALVDPNVGINDAVPAGKTYLDEYLGGMAFTTAPEPFAATQMPPELRYSALLEIEKVLQHVIANTVTYSKAVWMSLTPEERVMLLEGYTIGVAGGVADETQQIPLLACVANQLLGFYGNSMVLPFMIPAELVANQEAHAGVPLTTASVQEALTRYHTVGFSPPLSTIALPTHGVLGEAVLGHCPSAEKIDLTRFWNWQDSPGDEATSIGEVQVPDASLTAGLTAPNTLTGLSPIITNFSNAGPNADTSLLASLIQAGAAAQGFDIAQLTGSSALADLLKATLTTAESARKDALAGAQAMATKAMDSIPNVIAAKAAAAAGKKDDAAAKDAPTVTKVEPNHGKAADAITITGTNLTGATKVTVGGKALDAMAVVDATKITGKVPAGLTAGAVDVIVTTPKGDSAKSATSKFTVDP